MQIIERSNVGRMEEPIFVASISSFPILNGFLIYCFPNIDWRNPKWNRVKSSCEFLSELRCDVEFECEWVHGNVSNVDLTDSKSTIWSNSITIATMPMMRESSLKPNRLDFFLFFFFLLAMKPQLNKLTLFAYVLESVLPRVLYPYRNRAVVLLYFVFVYEIAVDSDIEWVICRIAALTDTDCEYKFLCLRHSGCFFVVVFFLRSMQSSLCILTQSRFLVLPGMTTIEFKWFCSAYLSMHARK